MSTLPRAPERLAIDGGTPVRTTPWPRWPEVSAESWREVFEPRLREVFLSGSEGLPGSVAHRFAAGWAQRVGASHGVMTPHGTDALMAALAGALDLDGIGEGGQVIMPNYTFVATASAALAVRCRVAFVDVEPRLFTLDPRAVEAAVGPETVAIVVVHLGGQAANMTALGEIARRHGLALVEDCAQAHGAAWRGQPVGGLGDAGAFSFQSSKNMTAGEGGCVTTNDYDLYERVVSFVDVGRRPGGERWEYPRLGWNYRPSEYLAALLEARLERFDELLARRRHNAAYLSGLLAPVDGIVPPDLAEGCSEHAWHLFMLLYQSDLFGGHSRQEFVQALTAEGIPAMAGYTQPLSDQGAFRGLREQYPGVVRVHESPHTRYACEHSVWLPQAVLLAESWELEAVAAAITKIKRAWTS